MVNSVLDIIFLYSCMLCYFSLVSRRKMSSSEEGELSSSYESNPKKKQKRIQRYRVDWERDPQFSPWLAPDTNVTKARCKWCDITMTADVSIIKMHKASKRHEKNDNSKSKSNLHNFFKPQSAQTQLEANIKNAEIKICGFLAAHNIPYLVINDLIPYLKSALPDSKILEGINLKRLKATNIVTNVIGASHKQDLASQQKNKNSPF